MPALRLQHFLEDRQVRYDTIAHPAAFTAQESPPPRTCADATSRIA